MNLTRALKNWFRPEPKTRPEPETRPEIETRPKLETGPRLIALSDWSENYHYLLQRYLDDLRKFRYSNAVCRERVLCCVPDEKPFRHLTSPEDILDSLRSSYKNCIFDGPSYGQSSWQGEDICQFSCCERCRSVLVTVKSLVDDTSLPNSSRPEISVRKKGRDALSLARRESPLLSVSIAWVDGAGKAQARVVDMVTRNGKGRIDTEHYGLAN